MESHALLSLTDAGIDAPSMNVLQSASPNTSKIFILPELLETIAGFLSPHDAFHLAQSSRMCFFAAVGQIWSSLEAMLHLFRLLPGLLVESSSLEGIIMVNTAT